MQFGLVILGLALWLPEFAVCADTIHHKIHRKKAHHKIRHNGHRIRSDPLPDANAEVVTVQGQKSDLAHSHDAEVSSIGPQELPTTPASAPSTVSMAASVDSFGAKDSQVQKGGWDAIKLARASMCVGMIKEHGADFDGNKGECVAFMDSSCGTDKITTPSGKGHCAEWYKLLAVATAAPPPVSDSKVAAPEPALAPKARKMAVEEGTAVHAARAKAAATEANKIATDSIHLVDNSKWSLEKARDAVHKARVDSAGLSHSQKHSLKTAEAKLREATKKAEYGQVKNAKYVKAKVDNTKLQDMEKKMAKLKKEEKKAEEKKHKDELEAMRKEIEELRQTLKKKEGEKDEDDELLKDLQEQIKEMEEAEKHEDGKDKKSHDELKAEIERLRAEIENMQDADAKVEYTIPKKASKPLPEKQEEEEEKEEEVEKYNVNMKPLSKSKEVEEEEEEEHQESGEATPVEQKGIDIDTAMPYGDLEPFGREDTAQELTESSIKESDGMVDQLERAEVAEEKRSVFRALTRLRGAAITSFDGVARSQTGNIDEYNKVHKWRNTHPLHHLADEESDVSKWAFPDNAD